MSENRDTRLKRLRLRSWRRGTKEMDLILGGFADDLLGTLDDQDLDAHEALMDENDQDLYAWICGNAPAPVAHGAALQRILNYLSKKSFRLPQKSGSV